MEEHHSFYPSSIDAKADSHSLHKAFKGIGTDEKVVIEILANRSKLQLQQISEEYKHQSDKKHSLIHALESEISGDFLKLAVAIVTPVVEFKARSLDKAVEGVGTREITLIDVLTQSTNAEIAMIASNDKLKKKILSDVSGDFKKILEELLKGHRPFGPISEERAAELAHEFYKAGEGKIGTDEKKYVNIICGNSPEALAQVEHHYKSKYKHGLRKAVDKETSGDFRTALIALLTPRYTYIAHRLHQAISGAGTDERTLIYFFGILEKHELHYVGEAFKKKFKHSLKDKVASDTSGDFRKLLLALF